MFHTSLQQLTVGDWIVNGVVLAVTAALLFLFFRPWVRTSKFWRATVTPLASIIGSGFLVVAPLLGFTVGNWALMAITAIVVLAYFVGGAVRYNIAHLESIIESDESDEGDETVIRWLGRAAKLSLALAYVIAVAFYLKLLAAFVMRLFHPDFAHLENWIATAIAAFIGGFGLWRGLSMLESMEIFTVEGKLSIIGGLLVGLLIYNGDLVMKNQWHLPQLKTDWSVKTLRQLLGAFLIVQGFETSRYLHGVYPPKHRINTMQFAQGIAAGVYILFVGLATILLGVFDNVSETGIIDLSARVAYVLPFTLIVGAGMSQFSAAVADTVSSGGLLEEATKGRIKRHKVYAGAAGYAIALLWLVDIFSVISYASRAFALYYAIQCTMAAVHAGSSGDKGRRVEKSLWFALLALLMLATAILGIPAETTGEHGGQ
ncbi:MAG: hypothetical protein HUJ26_15980 [Planctomycetaceae bacterium]|nr:hypothetical protein [Planctomycetaceae bacterium]